VPVWGGLSGPDVRPDSGVVVGLHEFGCGARRDDPSGVETVGCAALIRTPSDLVEVGELNSPCRHVVHGVVVHLAVGGFSHRPNRRNVCGGGDAVGPLGDDLDVAKREVAHGPQVISEVGAWSHHAASAA
jgi:hypothetical protein